MAGSGANPGANKNAPTAASGRTRDLTAFTVHRPWKRKLWEQIGSYLFISPWLIGFFSFTLLPILASFYFSFTRYDLFSPPKFHGLTNFIQMVNDQVFWKSLTVTFHYAFVSVPLRLIFALIVAMLFHRKAKMLRFYQTVYYLPSVVGGSIAVAVMWRRLFMADGALNAALGYLGIQTTTSWIGNPRTAIWTLIILAVWQFGSSMLIFLAGLKQIPESYYEAAEIDGANPRQKFFKITIPHLTPVILFNLVMQLINGFTVFTQAFVVSGGTGDPMNSTLVYALYVYKKAFEYTQMGYGSAMAWVMVVIIGLLTALIFKSSAVWVYYESKGETR